MPRATPERSFTVEISDALMLSETLMSYLKLLALTLTVWPERTLIAVMSLAFTLKLLLTSPARKPIETDALSEPLTPVRPTFTRR